MLQTFDLFEMFFLETLQRSLLGIVFVVFLLAVTLFGKNVISPRVRFLLWLLVPAQLLFFVSIPSSLSVFNYVPRFDFGITITKDTHVNSQSLAAQPMSLGVETQMPGQGGFEEFNAMIPLFANDELQRELQHESTVIVTEPSHEFSSTIETSDAKTLTPSQKNSVFFKALAGVWGVGALTFYTICFLQVTRFRHLIRTGSVVTDQKVLRLFEECKAMMQLNSWVMLVESSRVRSPFLVGVFRPVIVIPKWGTESLSHLELRHLFYHELAHLKRSDLITGWLMTLLLGLHWFNPFVWLAIRMMGCLREEASDAIVLQYLETEQQLDYGKTLLTLSQKLTQPQIVPGMAGILETRSFLKRRIEMITRPPHWKKNWALLAMSACLLFSLAMLTEAKPQETQSGSGNKQGTPFVEPKIILDEEEEEIIQETKKQVVEETQATQEAIDPKRVPKIVNMFPKNKAKDVDPNITQVYVTFDIPMTEGMAWAQRSNQTAIDSDENQRAFWTADKRTCVLPVQLSANKTYEVLMNFKPFLGFYSEGGMPAKEQFYTFKTGRGPISSNARTKNAEKNLTSESHSPSDEVTTTAKQSDEKFADASLETKARQAIKLMAKRGKCWLFAPNFDVESWSYHFKATGSGENAKTIEHDVKLDRSVSAPWEEIRGISYVSCLQSLAMLVNDDDTAETVRFKSVEFDSKEVNLHFVVTDGALTCYCGNGMRGQWFGYFKSGHREGKLTLDRKTMMPKLLVISDDQGERFGSYVKVGDGMYAPKRVQVKSGSMFFDLQFQVYAPGLWLLEKSTCTSKKGDEQFETHVENSNVVVNDQPSIADKSK